jgi:hypothetical protein
LNGPPTKLLLRGRRQRSGIFVLHEDSLSYQIPYCKLFFALVNKSSSLISILEKSRSMGVMLSSLKSLLEFHHSL